MLYLIGASSIYRAFEKAPYSLKSSILSLVWTIFQPQIGETQKPWLLTVANKLQKQKKFGVLARRHQQQYHKT